MPNQISTKIIRDDDERPLFTKYTDLGTKGRSYLSEIAIEPDGDIARVSLTFSEARLGDVVEKLTALLGEERMEDVNARQPGGASSAVVTLRVPTRETWKLLADLSTPKERGAEEVYPYLAPGIAAQVISHNSQQAGLGLEEQNLVELKTGRIDGPRAHLMGMRQPMEYIDRAAIHMPGSAISAVTEEAYPSGDRPYLKTVLDFTEDGQRKVGEAESLLSKEGIKVQKEHDRQGRRDYLRVSATAERVMQVLAQQGSDIIVPDVAKLIGERARSLHPEQDKYNAQVDADEQKGRKAGFALS